MSDSKEFAVPALPTQKQQKVEAPAPAPAQENTKRLPQPPPLKYEKPSWSAQPTYKYQLEVLKNGASLETVQGPRKEFVTIGRLPICDIPMEHPVSCHCMLCVRSNSQSIQIVDFSLPGHHSIQPRRRCIHLRHGQCTWHQSQQKAHSCQRIRAIETRRSDPLWREYAIVYI